ncbi:MAG: hypothetical protein CMB75_02295 [Euryarchaeota archaeon]|nr:hypothetical protein [Euryarchaeota archaeon]|tara:strand:- start:4976 stop:5563 length:588 start_codon:yes stop_codon:yes gene_type:complete
MMPHGIIPEACVVLGRFQPVHRGHASLFSSAEEWRRKHEPDMPLRIAIGSINKPQNLTNPWDAEEREMMLKASLRELDFDAEIVGIPDIDDPPRWVNHAEAYHGPSGVLITSDQPTAELYSSCGWEVKIIDLEDRDSLEGWRIRETARMMSTITDEMAILTVMSPTMQASVVETMIEMDAFRRLAFMGEGGEPVG